MNEALVIATKKRVSTKLFVFLMCLLSLIIILSATTVYFFCRYQLLSKKSDTTQILQQETEDVVESLKKMILLPKDEVPTVATINDVDRLKNQLFFKNARNGNNVVIYPISKIAIIYDPKTKIIMNIGPVDFPKPQSQ